jgi:NO-binding membrane sensor protein with MHYT domain
MYRVIGCVRDHHDPVLVIVAAAICFISCLGSIKVWWLGFDASAKSRRGWLLLAGCAAGFGVWATHFIAMIAYLPGLPVTYDLPLVLTSLVIAIAFISAGLSVTEAERTSRSWLGGGVIIGLAISAMHYLGAQAISLPGLLGWSPDLVAISLVISIGAASAALRAASGKRSRGNLVLSASLLAFAVTGLHFTAMTALIVMPDPTRAVDGGLSGPQIAWTIAGAAAALLIAGCCCGLLNRRRDALLR